MGKRGPKPRKPTRDAPKVVAGRAVDSEGRRLLHLQPGSLSELARAAGVKSKQTVGNWLAGTKTPDGDARRALLAAFGIPLRSWDQPPRVFGERARKPEAPTEPADISALPDTLTHCLELLSAVRVARIQNDLTPSEVTKLITTEERLLTQRHRFEKDRELIEDRIVRGHPTWVRIRKVMVRVLSKYPDAARALIPELEVIDAEVGQ